MRTDERARREAARILEVYERREREVPKDRYSLIQPDVLFRWQQLTRAVLGLLRREGLLPLRDRRILDVGCGSGGWLHDFERWGAQRENLAAIELRASRAEEVARRFGSANGGHGEGRGGADVRHGDATFLPWADRSFDIVLQSTVFTSVLDADVRRAMAAEMLRVVRPEGAILWYDFTYDNPRNPDVGGISRGELDRLFPACIIRARRVTLAPFVARRLVPLSWVGASVLEGTRLLNTHILALVRHGSTTDAGPAAQPTVT